LDALSHGVFLESLSKVLPGDIIINIISPFGFVASCSVSAVDEVVVHCRCVLGCNVDVLGQVAGDLVVFMKEGSGGSGDPGWKEANGVRGQGVDHFSMGISKNIDFSIWSQVGEGHGMVLVAFHVEDIKVSVKQPTLNRKEQQFQMVWAFKEVCSTNTNDLQAEDC
jgi:hypothetical protein